MRAPLTALAGSLLLACVIAVAPASAATPQVSKVTLSKFQPYWHGAVLSATFGGARSCEKKRTVKVYKRRDGKDQLVGTDLSSRSGRWSIPREPSPGTYYAKVAPRRDDKGPACLGDFSSSQIIG